MSAFNLRNGTIDRRRLSTADKQSYRPQQRQQAVARARAYRGKMAWDAHRERRTVDRTPGTGGFTQGISIQQQRLRDEGAKLERSKQLRNEGLIYNPS